MRNEIRRARLADSPEVAALTAELGYPAPGIEDRLGLILGRDDAAVLVAVVANRVIGWVHVHDAAAVQVAPFGEVGGLVVAETHRGTGVGESLLKAAEDWARARGHAELRVRSNAIRERAHRFYLGRGYRIEKTSLTFHKEI
jgi:GNAT superfamily N-acetyltransferase